MRLLLLSLAICAIATVTNSLTDDEERDPLHDIELERLLEIADEIANTAKTGTFERTAKYDNERETVNNDDDDDDKDDGLPYIEREIEYVQLARRVADQYIDESRRKSKDFTGASTTADALRSFNRPSQRTRMISEQRQRDYAELIALRILSGKDQRNLADIDLTAFTASRDPICNNPVDCSLNDNKNFVDGKEFRTIDGICNNKVNFSWGFAGVQHQRLIENEYDDGKFAFRTKSKTENESLPPARTVSNIVHGTPNPKGANDRDVSIALFYFMQFIDHDLAKTPEGHVRRNKKCCDTPTNFKKFCMPVVLGVPNEKFFRPNYCVEGRRSFTVRQCTGKVRNQINEITSYLDASMVYGSSTEEEHTLRTFIAGLMEQSTSELLPNSSRGDQLPCNLTINDHRKDSCFEAGDTRANVHPGLLTYHTLFVREHNRIARELLANFPKWSDERIYQETRKIIGAIIQHIVYDEMLPVLIGKDDLKKYGVNEAYQYDEKLDASMIQAFAICYRYHNLMPHVLNLGRESRSSAEVFRTENQEFAITTPFHVTNHNYRGIDEVTLGMVVSKCPHVDRLMNSATRNLLFLDKNGNSNDLATLNILRGRDWGTPGYNKYRFWCGLGKASSFDDKHLRYTLSDTNIEKLKLAYNNIDDVDLWPGMISEKPLPGTISGATQSCILAKHFANIKHGDRFWYENKVNGFSGRQLRAIQKVSIAGVLCRNLNVQFMRTSAFRTNSKWEPCADILARERMNFKGWSR